MVVLGFFWISIYVVRGHKICLPSEYLLRRPNFEKKRCYTLIQFWLIQLSSSVQGESDWSFHWWSDLSKRDLWQKLAEYGENFWKSRWYRNPSYNNSIPLESLEVQGQLCISIYACNDVLYTSSTSKVKAHDRDKIIHSIYGPIYDRTQHMYIARMLKALTSCWSGSGTAHDCLVSVVFDLG